MPTALENRRAIALFLALFLLPALLLIGFSVNLYQEKSATEKALTIQAASHHLAATRRVINNTFHLISSDLFLLASDAAVSRILSGQASDRDYREMKSEFLAFARFKGIYDQVRLIDAHGRERLRINYNNGKMVSVPQSALQNKSNRYYFRNAIKLGKNEVYFSPFDLNIEHGAIEHPYKPMIRIAMPIVGPDGDKLGILVLNYLGRNVLNILDDRSDDSGGMTMLVNSMGYWLKGMSSGDAWGFMFPNGQQKTMVVSDPDVWSAMQQSSGHLFTPQGLYSFGKIYPLQNFHPKGITVNTAKQHYLWYLVHFIPKNRLFPGARRLYRKLLWRDSVALLVWGVMSAFLAISIRRHRLAEENLNETHAYMHEVLNNAFDGIITVNGDGMIQSFNPSAGRIFGYRRDEVIHRHIDMLIPPEYRQQHQAYIEELKREGERPLKQQREVAGLRKDGSLFPMEVSIGVSRSDDEWMFTAVFRDISERRELQKQLERMAVTDALTGAYNRHSLKERLEQECDRARRYGRALSLLMLDIDHFKSINDRFGHDVGDTYLIAFTKLLMRTCRETDMVYRYGGEEFLVVLPESDAEHAGQLAKRLMQEVRRLTIDVRGEAVSTTVSVGAALFDGQEEADILLKHADQAVYDAKHSGRDCFRSA